MNVDGASGAGTSCSFELDPWAAICRNDANAREGSGCIRFCSLSGDRVGVQRVLFGSRS